MLQKRRWGFAATPLEDKTPHWMLPFASGRENFPDLDLLLAEHRASAYHLHSTFAERCQVAADAEGGALTDLPEHIVCCDSSSTSWAEVGTLPSRALARTLLVWLCFWRWWL